MRSAIVVFTLLVFCTAGWAPPVAAQQGDAQTSKAFKRQSERERKAAEQREKKDQALDELRIEIQPEADRVVRRMLERTYDDPLANGYINAIGQSLVPEEASSGLSFSFRVLADHRPNAFAMPDGRIFVSSGLLAFVENEAQLAVVLGHEIAHVVEGHTLDSIRKQRSSDKRNKIIGTAAGAALGGILGGKKGGAAQAAAGAAIGAAAGAMIANAVTAILQGKYSREQEKEADLIGAEIAMANGFDPQAGVSLFEKLHRLYGRRQRGIRSMAPGGPATGLGSGAAGLDGAQQPSQGRCPRPGHQGPDLRRSGQPLHEHAVCRRALHGQRPLRARHFRAAPRRQHPACRAHRPLRPGIGRARVRAEGSPERPEASVGDGADLPPGGAYRGTPRQGARAAHAGSRGGPPAALPGHPPGPGVPSRDPGGRFRGGCGEPQDVRAWPHPTSTDPIRKT